jgi:hypothetical protein
MLMAAREDLDLDEAAAEGIVALDLRSLRVTACRQSGPTCRSRLEPDEKAASRPSRGHPSAALSRLDGNVN